MDQTVVQAKRFGIFSCSPDTPLLAASRSMVAEDVSALIVLDREGFLEGIITRTDLLRALRYDPEWETQPVEKYMSREVVSVTSQTPLSRVAELLLEKHIHRVVVVREEMGHKRPLSVVSAADLVYHMVKSA